METPGPSTVMGDTSNVIMRVLSDMLFNLASES